MGAADLVCFSHLRWDSVYQRPNHLMARAARDRRVFFVEEPVDAAEAETPEVRLAGSVNVVRPRLPELDDERKTAHAHQRQWLRRQMAAFFHEQRIDRPWLWYYTPLAARWTSHLSRSVVVYDCMDELSAFRFASPVLPSLERRLLARSDLVFTGGSSLYQAKRILHPRTYLFPSSVDREFFARAREAQPDPPDQSAIPAPRLGYYGVIDERVDLALVAAIAAARRDWHVVMVGPIAKISESELPQAPNLHWLGQKPYDQLPAYLAGWDVALMPFAQNEATRHISPTKTPEYLAGGRPVVATPIADVIEPYGRLGLVEIADGLAAFVEAVERAMRRDPGALIARADEFLAGQSWDRTWAQMEALVNAAAAQTTGAAA